MWLPGPGVMIARRSRRPGGERTKETAMQANDIGVWLGLDVGKDSHHACALD